LNYDNDKYSIKTELEARFELTSDEINEIYEIISDNFDELHAASQGLICA